MPTGRPPTGPTAGQNRPTAVAAATRALPPPPLEVMSASVSEAGVRGVVTQVVGLVVGLALSLLLIYVINVQSFGWTIQFHAPLPFLAQSTLAILVATTIAGLYPARLAGRFDLSDVTGGQE